MAKTPNRTALQGLQLGGVDLSGAEVPENIKESYQMGLDMVAEVSRNARGIFLSLIGGCLFALLTLLSLDEKGEVTLPLLLIGIPAKWFLTLTPLVLFLTFAYFHFYLQKLWESAAKLPAFFPDGRSLDELIYPWLMNETVRYYFPNLTSRNEELAFSHLRRFVPWLLGWWAVPATLLFFAGKTIIADLTQSNTWMPSWAGWFSLGIFLLSIIFAVQFNYHAAKTLRGE